MPRWAVSAETVRSTNTTCEKPMRRKRFYAYERRSGGTCFFDRSMHDHLQRYPHTIGHYQLTRFLGTSALLSTEEAAAQGWMAKPSRRAS